MTIVFADLEVSADHDLHDLEATIYDVCKTLPDVPIVVFSENNIYPPLELKNVTCGIKFRIHNGPLSLSHHDNRIENIIRTENILILPDFVRISSLNLAVLDEVIDNLKTNEVRILPTKEKTKCIQLTLEQRYWTLRMDEGVSFHCDFVPDRAGLLLKTRSWLNLKDPLLRPIQDSFFIQKKVRGMNVFVEDKLRLKLDDRLLSDHQLQGMLDLYRQKHLRNLYPTLGIKRVIRENSVVEWYGCRKDTARCFPTIVDDMADYLYEGKWTPPCCLHHLRETAVHVLNILDQYDIRHWLEGGSLLGAARSGDIIPWDNDVDIGIYADDIYKLAIFETCSTQGPVKDERDFVWEKAREGNFFRVHFSPTNRIHVDIFPFHSVNGTMTKDFWFPDHPQDRPFPESFLIPLKKMSFVGIQASVPNNVREFLELKFGVGVIENPRLPNKVIP